MSYVVYVCLCLCVLYNVHIGCPAVANYLPTSKVFTFKQKKIKGSLEGESPQDPNLN